MRLKIGSRVKIHTPKSKTFHGMVGRIVGKSDMRGFWRVKLSAYKNASWVEFFATELRHKA